MILAFAQAQADWLVDDRCLAWNLQPIPSSFARGRYIAGVQQHDHLEMCVTVEGKGVIEIGDRRYRMASPAVVVVEPGTPHCEAFDARQHPYTAVWVCWFANHVLLYANAYRPDVGWYCPWEWKLSQTHERRLRKWYEGVGSSDHFEQIRAAMLSALGDVAYRLSEHAGKDSHVTPGHERVLRWVQNYIDQHYMHELDVQQIAELTRYTPNYLNTLFSEWMGQGLHAYTVQKRMTRALELCRQTTLPMHEIALQVGLSDPLYFSRAFSRFHGFSPRQARRDARQP